MGHKEDLLEGAKRSLVEHGYAGTTARDIVAASHTNLASIGYHFGSKDALLTQAMIELIGEWGKKFEAAAAAHGESGPAARFEGLWTQVLKLFGSDRAVLMASVDIATQATRSAELRAIFAATYVEVRRELPKDFLGLEGVDERTRTAVGGLLLALISGMSMQYLLDPEGTPTAEELTLGMQTIGRLFAGGSRG